MTRTCRLSESITTADLQWRERYQEVMADRDYWRSRAESWEARYVEASKQVSTLAAKVIDTPDSPPDTQLPHSLEVALKRYATGQPADVVRAMRREVLDVWANTEGDEDRKQIAALGRLTAGDGSRVAAFLGEM